MEIQVECFVMLDDWNAYGMTSFAGQSQTLTVLWRGMYGIILQELIWQAHMACSA